MRTEGLQHGIALRFVECPNGRYMAVQKPVFENLINNALVKTGRVQISRLLGLQQLGVKRWGRDQKPEAQAGRQCLAETAHVNAAVRVARRQGGRRRRVKPQVTVGVVFNHGQADAGRFGAEQRAPGFAHQLARGVLKIRQHV